MLTIQAFEKRKHILTPLLAKLAWNAKAKLKTYFIETYITKPFCQSVLKMGTR